jgi:hypothetical protein
MGVTGQPPSLPLAAGAAMIVGAAVWGSRAPTH